MNFKKMFSLRSGYKILLIDDISSSLARIKNMLENESLKVISASPLDITNILSKERPHLVLLNAGINRKSGLRVINLIRKRYPQLPIILVSSACKSLPSGIARKIGISDFLHEPFGRDAVLSKIQCVLTREEGGNENN